MKKISELLPTSLAEAVDPDVDIDWTDRVNEASFAHWARSKSGTEKIRVNRLLQAPKSEVDDNVLEFLVYHELLHHLLPGNGHDTRFREYEARWDGYVECNRFLDSLHEEYDTGPESYN